MIQYLIAHDLGTSGDKASLFSTEGELVASCTVPYEVHFFHDNYAEQNPRDWWEAVCRATREITRSIAAEDVLALSFSSQMQACIAVDKQGNALRPAMIWADMRAQEQAEHLIGTVGFDRMYEINGHRPSASYSIEKLMWIRDHEPEIYEKTYKMLLAKDYIICRLTGEFVTDESEASGTDAFDLQNRTWSEEVLKASGIDPGKLPRIHASTDVVGSLCADAASAMGLTSRTAIVCGGGDGPCSALGAGSIADGQMFLSYGTSAWIAGTADEVFMDSRKSLICFAHVIPGKCMPCGTMQSAGSSYAYIKKVLCQEEIALSHRLSAPIDITCAGDQSSLCDNGISQGAASEGVSAYDLMNELVLKSPPGAKGLIFLPYLLGERSPRWNPDTSGSFLGIRTEHEKCDYIRAVLEGVAMNLAIIMQAQSERGEIRELVLTGGGARGDVPAQILADVLGVPLHRLDHVETSTSVAAAVIAGVGVGAFPDFSVVGKFVRREKTFWPDEAYCEVYDRQKQLFEKGYECLRAYYEMDTRL
ncbi:MAG: FGGY-family carbohydrate kinase [Lachnospiraceae bacterium]|nr:FGGY-family carbohydrate kinase [Lachnospiraceae bacterium]